jgi:hypothetical protein
MPTFEPLEPGELCQEPDDNGDYTCPICQDYTGGRTSVEAHITGKSDDSHQGKVGRNFRTRDENGDLCISEKEIFSLEDGSSNQATKSIDAEPEDVSTTPEPVQSKAEQEGEDGELQNSNEPEDEDGGVAGILIGVTLALLIWLAQKTDNEDQIEMEF